MSIYLQYQFPTRYEFYLRIPAGTIFFDIPTLDDDCKGYDIN